MRILIFLLALTSAFFVSADEVQRVPAKQVNVPTSGFTESSFGFPPSYSSLDEAYDAIRGNVCVNSGYPDCIEQSREVREYVHSPTKTRYVYTVMWTHSGGQGISNNLTLYTDSEIDYVCPPDSNPAFTVGPVDIDGQKYCEEPPKDCPAGYHSRAVSKALGSSDCMPKECPPAGVGESLSSTPMTGGVPFSGGGMYCNDGCAYSVNAEQISSDKYAVGTSQGAACGDKPYDNKKLADEGDTGECSVSTGDVPLLSCPNANPTTPEKDPHNNDDSKTPEDETPEKPKETCAEGDAACNLKNVETEIENSTNKQIDNDNKLHNKKIDADTKNTNALLNILESIDTSILLQTQQDDRLHAVTVSKFNELVDAVNGIETGGSGGGGGGNGSGTGDDCEGDPSDCVPIDGAEIPSETVNLNQYADKYDDWLPNAELPSEKCIVISTGRSLCLSFESFILLFQSISGLMVIAALMHSARIISGAI
jgi:hypothetical protein